MWKPQGYNHRPERATYQTGFSLVSPGSPVTCTYLERRRPSCPLLHKILGQEHVRGFPEPGGRLVRATKEGVVLLCDDTSGRTRRVQISHVLCERHKSRLSERAPAHDACFGAMQISQLLAPVIISLTWRYVFGPPSPCERASRAEGLARATHKTKKRELGPNPPMEECCRPHSPGRGFAASNVELLRCMAKMHFG